ncbi:MAG: CBS domain-containing protein [Sedimentisphaerales bacterium]|nr:CBS domain-containing protein [Sedimentisphaerales bacterium]
MESAAQAVRADDVATGLDGHAEPEAGPRELTVRDVMSEDIVTATADSTVFRAAQTMSEHHVSCLLIPGANGVEGILTEKDVLKAVAEPGVDFRRLQVADRMSSPVAVTPATLSVIKAGKVMENMNIKRLPVVEDEKLLGLVTQTDITRALVSLSPLRSVADIMSPNVATVPAEATVAAAARIMSDKGISCVVAMHRREVTGILTEKDLLKRVVALQKDPAQTHVADVMSFPIMSVPPTDSVITTTRKMDQMHLHRLVVADGSKICGIVTQTDLMRVIRTELDRLESQRRRLTALLRRDGQNPGTRQQDD